MRLRSLILLMTLSAGTVGFVIAGADKEKPDSAAKTKAGSAPKAEPKVFPAKKGEKEAEAAVRKSAETFVTAYNSHNAKACASGFTATAEFVTEDGTTIRGQEAIERHFVAVFSEAPQVRLELTVESTRLVAANVAIEEGRVSLTPVPGSTVASSRYVAVHVYQDGQWLLARAHDYPAEAEIRSNFECLRELEWLVGEWMQEDEASLIVTSCQWVDRKNFLLQEFTMRIGNHDPITGSTRIGWDPQTQQIKSWTFDSEGGYSESLWTRGEKKWVLKARGVTHSGRNFSGTSVIRQIDSGTMSWESRDRVEGGVLVPDRQPIVIKRRPPPPGE